MMVSMAKHVKFTLHVVNLWLLLWYVANFYILAINIEVKCTPRKAFVPGDTLKILTCRQSGDIRCNSRGPTNCTIFACVL